MEKISRIVPASPRLQSVDMSRERPVRSSAPGFGAPVSESTNRGPMKSAIAESARVYNETYGPDAKLAREAESVKKLADSFFLNQAKLPLTAQPEKNETENVEKNIETKDDEIIPADKPEEWIDIHAIEQSKDAEQTTSAPYSKRI